VQQATDDTPLDPRASANERQKKPSDDPPVAAVTELDVKLRVVSTDSGALLWTSAVVVSALVHAGLAWLLFCWISLEVLPEESPPAVVIELAPIAVAPTADPQDVAPGPEASEAHPQPAPTSAENAMGEASEPDSAPAPSDKPTSSPPTISSTVANLSPTEPSAARASLVSHAAEEITWGKLSGTASS
jgi:cytoskeletal protein RodZ